MGQLFCFQNLLRKRKTGFIFGVFWGQIGQRNPRSPVFDRNRTKNFPFLQKRLFSENPQPRFRLLGAFCFSGFFQFWKMAILAKTGSILEPEIPYKTSVSGFAQVLSSFFDPPKMASTAVYLRFWGPKWGKKWAGFEKCVKNREFWVKIALYAPMRRFSDPDFSGFLDVFDGFGLLEPPICLLFTYSESQIGGSVFWGKILAKNLNKSSILRKSQTRAAVFFDKNLKFSAFFKNKWFSEPEKYVWAGKTMPVVSIDLPRTKFFVFEKIENDAAPEGPKTRFSKNPFSKTRCLVLRFSGS